MCIACSPKMSQRHNLKPPIDEDKILQFPKEQESLKVSQSDNYRKKNKKQDV